MGFQNQKETIKENLTEAPPLPSKTRVAPPKRVTALTFGTREKKIEKVQRRRWHEMMNAHGGTLGTSECPSNKLRSSLINCENKYSTMDFLLHEGTQSRCTLGAAARLGPSLRLCN